jgi:putative ABC transport system substrate-binding protein
LELIKKYGLDSESIAKKSKRIFEIKNRKRYLEKKNSGAVFLSGNGRRKMKKIISMFITGTLLFSLLVMGMTGCGEKDEKLVVGIAQFAEHPSLDNCREGFIAGLAEAGYVEGENLEIRYENANADGAVAAQIANEFVSSGVDLICAIATPAAQSCFSAAMDSDIPVVFSAVTDPVAAELAMEDGYGAGEITGTSDALPVEEQLQMIRTMLPDAEKIGIIYTTSETNSVSTIAQYKELAGEYGFEIVEKGITATAEVSQAADSILTEVDCVTNLTDNTVVSALSVLLDKAGEKNIPVFGSEVEQVKNGCLAAMGIEYIGLGKQTGLMAAKILNGEKKASEIKFE